MAKLKAVYKSDATLTEVQTSGTVAKYLYSSYTGSPPANDMTADITGFAYNPNNGLYAIDSATGGYSGWFTVHHTLQQPETHAAFAHCESSAGKLCITIPKPSKILSVQITSRSTSCHLKNKDKTKKPGTHTTTGTFGGLILPSLAAFNRQCFARFNHEWKDPGPWAGRDAWNAHAAACPVMNYKGIIKTLTGKQYWVLANKYHTNAYMIPGAPMTAADVNIIWQTPAHDWTPPTPQIVRTQLESNGHLQIWTPWDDHYNQCIMQPEISSPPTSPLPTTARSHVTGGENYCDYEDTLARWDMDISFPFFPNGLRGTITFAVRIFHFYKWTFSNYVWLRATPA